VLSQALLISKCVFSEKAINQMTIFLLMHLAVLAFSSRSDESYINQRIAREYIKCLCLRLTERIKAYYDSPRDKLSEI